MKKVLFAAAIMMAAGAKAQQVNYTISGVSKDNGAKVVVIDAQARKIINDGTPVTVNLNDTTVTGSAQNERLVRYDIDMNAAYGKLGVKAGLEKIYTDEVNTMIPVAFVEQYLEEFGLEKLQKMMAAKPVWANHPAV